MGKPQGLFRRRQGSPDRSGTQGPLREEWKGANEQAHRDNYERLIEILVKVQAGPTDLKP